MASPLVPLQPTLVLPVLSDQSPPKRVAVGQPVEQEMEEPSTLSSPSSKKPKLDSSSSQPQQPRQQQEAPAVDNNVDPHKYKGCRIAKYFDDGLYFGTVVECLVCKDAAQTEDVTATTNKNPTAPQNRTISCWKIHYDDDDAEDLEFLELQAGIRLFQEKQKRVEEATTQSSSPSSQTPTTQTKIRADRSSLPSLPELLSPSIVQGSINSIHDKKDLFSMPLQPPSSATYTTTTTTTTIDSSFSSPSSPPQPPQKESSSLLPPFLHTRVAKYFDGILYFGKIVRFSTLIENVSDDSDEFLTANYYDMENKNALWHVLFDDGDQEDWVLNEVHDGIQLCQQMLGRIFNNNNINNINNNNDSSQSPSLPFLHKRVAKYFDNVLYFGMVVGMQGLVNATIDNDKDEKTTLTTAGTSDSPHETQITNNSTTDTATTTTTITLQNDTTDPTQTSSLPPMSDTTTTTAASTMENTTSTSTTDADAEKNVLWNILYDDGDQEDWDIQEVQQGIQLCREQASVVDGDGCDLWDIFNMPDNDRDSWAFSSASFFPNSIRKNAKNVAKFFLFVLERQNCWIRRRVHYNNNNNTGEQPQQLSDCYWTRSRVMREYYFCNNYRQLDRGTAFFHHHVVKSMFPNNRTSEWTDWLEQVLWASYCYRLVNKVESFFSASSSSNGRDGVTSLPTSTFGRIPNRGEWPAFRKLVQQAKDYCGAGSNFAGFFTGAHQTCSFDNYMIWMDTVADPKSSRLENVTAAAVATNEGSVLQSVFHAIHLNLPGCGTFFSWQIVCDLLESNALPNVKQMDFCFLGKGAKAGIGEVFFNNKPPKGLRNEEYMNYTKMLVSYQNNVYHQLKAQDGIQLEFPKWRGHPITLKEMEHALCEFSKWQRIERALNAGKASTGQRLRKSRCHLDGTLRCQGCQKLLKEKPQTQDQTRTTSPVVLCNACNQGYCDECDPSERDLVYWVCPPCREFDSFQWQV